MRFGNVHKGCPGKSDFLRFALSPHDQKVFRMRLSLNYKCPYLQYILMDASYFPISLLRHDFSETTN